MASIPLTGTATQIAERLHNLVYVPGEDVIKVGSHVKKELVEKAMARLRPGQEIKIEISETIAQYEEKLK